MGFALLGGLLVSFASLFLGMPPAVEDVALGRVAPEKCLFYLSWSGAAKPDPASKNRAEQLLADEEVRMFLDGIKDRIGKIPLRELTGGEADEETIKAGLYIYKTVLTKPTALFVGGVVLKSNGSGSGKPDDADSAKPGEAKGEEKKPGGLELGDVKFALVVNAGGEIDEFKKAIDKLVAVALAKSEIKRGPEATIDALPPLFRLEKRARRAGAVRPLIPGH